MKKNIFIDGEVGTTGLQVHEKLSQHPNVNILPMDYTKTVSYTHLTLPTTD